MKKDQLFYFGIKNHGNGFRSKYQQILEQEALVQSNPVERGNQITETIHQPTSYFISSIHRYYLFHI